MSLRCSRLVLAATVEIELCVVVGGMTVIELLACAMRLDCGGIVAVIYGRV